MFTRYRNWSKGTPENLRILKFAIAFEHEIQKSKLLTSLEKETSREHPILVNYKAVALEKTICNAHTKAAVSYRLNLPLNPGKLIPTNNSYK